MVCACVGMRMHLDVAACAHATKFICDKFAHHHKANHAIPFRKNHSEAFGHMVCACVGACECMWASQHGHTQEAGVERPCALCCRESLENVVTRNSGHQGFRVLIKSFLADLKSFLTAPAWTCLQMPRHSYNNTLMLLRHVLLSEKNKRQIRRPLDKITRVKIDQSISTCFQPQR